MPKNIALFIDGTWNANDPGYLQTNVHKLYQAASQAQGGFNIEDGVPVAVNDSPQVVHYLKGVGTAGKLNQAVGGVTGLGTKQRITEAYLFLALNYKPNDNIYIFGFSRGAFAARALAGFVGVVGPRLANDKATRKKILRAYKLYERAQGDEPYKGALRDYLHVPPVATEETSSIPIHFIGVWDTVARLGIQAGRFDMTRYWTKHHNHPKLPYHIDHARHALALHDLRPEFEPTLWHEKSRDDQSLEQVWFPGAHSDIGGGYTVSTLSDMTLRWMAAESTRHALRLDWAYLPPDVPDASAKVHYAMLLEKPAPRRALAQLDQPSQKAVVTSFFIHAMVGKQLLSEVPRQWRYEQSSKDAKRAKRRKRSLKDYSVALKEADEKALHLLLALSCGHGKRPIQ